jgi:H+-transporting ATPase
MRNMTGAAIVLGLSKLLFSTSLLALGRFGLQLDAAALQTLAFITLVFGNQALLFVLRERRHLWSSLPSAWVLASSAADVAIVSTLALSGILMEPLSLGIVAGVFAAAVGLALILDQMRGPVMAGFKVR